MPGQLEPEQLKSDLILPKVVQGIMLTLLITYIIVCFIFDDQLQQPLPEAQRVLIRTLLYIVAIATLPLTNLLRYIQLRLNQTMPFANAVPRLEAKKRYLVTIIVSMSLIESVGIFGFVMFILGDSFNTLFIFSGIAALGLFLYRPKVNEYEAIVEALTTEKT